ncbi:hypothetical protein R3P38DRAFT_2828012, partial [Favolaschia claudopus]
AGVEFTQFVAGLGIKKISDSWGHKLSSKYITKCMIKSQPNILPHRWDRTTVIQILAKECTFGQTGQQ